MDMYELLVVFALIFYVLLSLKDTIKEIRWYARLKKMNCAYKRYSYFLSMGLVESATIIENQVGFTVRDGRWK